MSKASEQLQIAHRAIADAISALSEIVVNRCDGWDCLPSYERSKLVRLHHRLLEFREELDRCPSPRYARAAGHLRAAVAGKARRAR